MRSFRPLLATVYAALLLSPATALPAEDATVRLNALLEREWQRDLADNPLLASYRGDTRYDDRWPDISPTAQAARDAADAQALVDLAAIPREALSSANQLTWDLFRIEYENRVAVAPFHPEYYELRAREGPQSLNEIAENMPFEKTADYDTWLRRLAALRLGAYQLLHMRVPHRAAVAESVDLARAAAPHSSGFVNAVLRRLSRDGPPAKVTDSACAW